MNNFNTSYTPSGTQHFRWKVVDADGNPQTSVSVTVKHDSSWWKDGTEYSSIKHDSQTSAKVMDDLYVSDPKGATQSFELECYAEVDSKTTVFEYENWMGSLGSAFEAVRLRDVCIPGAHDAGTYGISSHSDSGGDIATWLIDLPSGTYQLARCQGLSIEQQLLAGVRYFDLRVDLKGFMAITHSWRAEPIDAVIRDVARFLKSHPQEFVILDFQHFYRMNAYNYTKLANLLKAELSITDKGTTVSLIAPPSQINVSSTVGDLRKHKYQAIVLIDTADDFPANFFSLYPMFWNRGDSIYSPWANAHNLTDLKVFLDGVLRGGPPTAQFFVLQGIENPSGVRYAWDGGFDLVVYNSTFTLKDGYASECTPAVVGWMKSDWKEQPLNIVMVDFVELGNFVPTCVARNRAALATPKMSLAREDVAPSSIRLSGTVTVEARLKWQSTGFYVTPMDELEVTVEGGSWTANPSTGSVGASGNPRYTAKAGYALPGQYEGALIGRVGGETFLVGTGGTISPDAQSGTLELCINDDLGDFYGDGFSDNRGSLTVKIARVVPKIPE